MSTKPEYNQGKNRLQTPQNLPIELQHKFQTELTQQEQIIVALLALFDAGSTQFELQRRLRLQKEDFKNLAAILDSLVAKGMIFHQQNSMGVDTYQIMGWKMNR